jgi:SAM-dependent methyltransferase
MDAQAREDLAERIPDGARSVLDVGCSRGATAGALRARGVNRLVGIEPDPEDAAAAAAVYDLVIPHPLEEVVEDFAGQFDAVLFGDVLEHLVDPAGALRRVRPWLARDGTLVASVPNFGHWAVVADLIEGRFEYVPYSTLSGTHIRFFTRRTVHDLFGASGFAVVRLDTVELAPSPGGAQRLARLAAFPGASPDLTAAEFLIVARPH